MPTDIATLRGCVLSGAEIDELIAELIHVDFYVLATERVEKTLRALPALLDEIERLRAVAEAARRFVTESYRPLLSDDAARFDVLRTALAALDAGEGNRG